MGKLGGGIGSGLAVVALIACTGDDPVAPVGSGTSGGTSSGGTSGGSPLDGGMVDPPRDCPQSCLPLAPAGWLGPSAVYDGAYAETPAECTGFYSRFEIKGERLGRTPAPDCTCAASTASGAGCQASLDVYGDTGCNGATSSAVVENGATCVKLYRGVTPTNVNTRLSRPIAVTGTCSASTPTMAALPPVFERQAVACGRVQNAECEGRPDCTKTPLPEGKLSRLCVHKKGDVPCTSADYAERFVVFEKTDDQRACECATQIAGTCPQVELYTDSNCENPDGRVVGGQCYSDVRAARIPGAPTNVQCDVTKLAKGDLVQSEPVTFCCNL